MTSRVQMLSLLGLAASATQDEVKQRYRELARSFHPDVNTTDERAAARFRAISAAYRELCTTEDAPILLTERKAPTVPASPSAAGGARAPRVVIVKVTLAQVITGAQIQLSVDGNNTLVSVPPGADTGTLIGVGHSGVVAEVHVAPDPRFRRRGADLLTVLSIAADVADQGARIELPTPSGLVTVVIPRHSRHGDAVRVVARGVPSPSGRGDLYVELRR